MTTPVAIGSPSKPFLNKKIGKQREDCAARTFPFSPAFLFENDWQLLRLRGGGHRLFHFLIRENGLHVVQLLEGVLQLHDRLRSGDV